MVPKGESRSNLVGLNDIYATLCDLAGIEVPKNQAKDSVSFSKQLFDENAMSRESIGAWTYFNGTLHYESVRKNEMKLIRHYSSGILQMYNLTSDVGEQYDISLENESLAAEMLESLKRIGPCDDDKGKFKVDQKPNGKVVRRTCGWFSKGKTKQRCKKYPAGQDHCRYTCALRNRKYCVSNITIT